MKKNNEDNNKENKMSEEKIVVSSDEKKVSKKVAVELEVDTSDDGPSTVAGTTINIELGAETIGDYIDMVVADGKIYISGQSKLDGAYTLA